MDEEEFADIIFKTIQIFVIENIWTLVSVTSTFESVINDKSALIEVIIWQATIHYVNW